MAILPEQSKIILYFLLATILSSLVFGRTSLADGFPDLSEGGFPPNKLDSNRILHLLYQFEYWVKR